MDQLWRTEARPANLAEVVEDGLVRCHLSPRHCTLREGQNGFCGVRANRNGRLVTLNYGKSVHLTEEMIETEAVNHYSPGERILSLGNIGCMMNCSYCHNWKTSQSRFVEDADVHYYTPEQVVDLAQRHGIRCLSWTYNDPVVWHEFVLDTARLARSAGLINLYKSAFFISAEAIEELLPVIDIFSISLKSMSAEYYRRYAKGRLEPVLDGIRQVYRSGAHLEVSNLMITDLSDDEGSARQIAEWVLGELDAAVPLHFVRFHPDYRMTDRERTPIPRLVRACELARKMGCEHVYMGNVYDTPWSNTLCVGCGAELVHRYGLNATVVGLDEAGRCRACGRDAHIRSPLHAVAAPITVLKPEVLDGMDRRQYRWHGDIRSVHVLFANGGAASAVGYHRRLDSNGGAPHWRWIELRPGESFRFSIAKGDVDETGVEVAFPASVRADLHEVYDRAHFPTVSVDHGVADNDRSPLPIYSRAVNAR